MLERERGGGGGRREEEEGVVALNLHTEPLKTGIFWLEPVPRCEPSTYQPM